MYFYIGVVVSFSFVCGGSVSIFIEDFSLVLLVQGDWNFL